MVVAAAVAMMAAGSGTRLGKFLMLARPATSARIVEITPMPWRGLT